MAKVHPRFGTPAFAIIADSAWACILAVTGTFEQLFTYVAFTGWIFYELGAAALFIYRRKRPELQEPYRVPSYPWTPLVFVLAAFALVLNTVLVQPSRGLVALGIVLLGIPAYAIWQRVGQRL